MSTAATERKLAAFGMLEVGWHYGSGVPVSPLSLERARRTLDLYSHFGITETDAFCGSEGEVMVTAYLGGHYIECDFVSGTEINFRHENSYNQVVQEAILKAEDDLSAVVSKAVREARGGKWLLSDLSIRQITTGEGTVSRTTFSKIPAKTVVLPYLILNVREQLRAKFARTSGSFTEALLASRRRSGSSNSQTSSPPTAMRRQSFAVRKTPSLATNAIIMWRTPLTATYAESRRIGSSKT
jgi:hypothetical protein